eukprot:4653927-Amphidinium_carterae.1
MGVSKEAVAMVSGIAVTALCPERLALSIIRHLEGPCCHIALRRMARQRPPNWERSCFWDCQGDK